VKNNVNSSPNEIKQKNSLSDNDWDIDVNQYTKVIERFVYNGEERKEQDHLYYDENKNLILRIRLNVNINEEEARDLYKYHNNELIEYKRWFMEPNKNQQKRWMHGITEYTEENGNIIKIVKENRDDDDYKIVEKTVKTKDGKLISTEVNTFDGVYYYDEYNEKGELVLSIYEHEFSYGRHHETYKYKYDNKGNIIHRETYENDTLVEEIMYQYTENNLVAVKITNSYRYDTVLKNEFQYNDSGNKISERRFEKDVETLSWYYIYDKENRLIRRDEVTDHAYRYWIYDYP
jgi:hypothetical protein